MFKKKTASNVDKRQRSEKTLPRSKNYSYYESRSTNDGKERVRSDDTKKINRPNPTNSRPWYLKIINVLIILLVILFIVDDLILSSQPKLIIAGDTNTTKLFSVSQTKYQTAANLLFAQSILSRSKITINTSSMALKLEEEFPELSDVSISLPLIGHQPIITVVPAQPALIVTPKSQTGSFLVATNGRVLATSIAWPKNTLPKVIDETGISYAVGRTTMSPLDIGFIELVWSQFMAKGVTITSMTLPAQTRELDVYVAGEPYFVKFNLEDNTDADQQIGTYFATRQYLTENQITPSQYINVMVVGRVYYQ